VAVSLGIAGSHDYYVSMRPPVTAKTGSAGAVRDAKMAQDRGKRWMRGPARTRAGHAVACVKADSLVAAKKAERLAARHPPGLTCSPGPSQRGGVAVSATESEEANKAVVRRLVEEAWNGNSPDLLDELCWPDIVEHLPRFGATEGLSEPRRTAGVVPNRLPGSASGDARPVRRAGSGGGTRNAACDPGAGAVRGGADGQVGRNGRGAGGATA
jgi:hypothetical protein